MNGKVCDILDGQEREDLAATLSEEVLRQHVREEFSNADEVLAFADRHGLSVGDFFTTENIPLEWDVLPVRKAGRFDIRKHTVSQRPYLHNHDFYEMIYVRRGICKQLLREENASERELVLHAGQAALISPGGIHTLHRASKEDVILKLVLPRSLYEKIGNGCLSVPPASCTVFESVSAEAETLFLRLLAENAACRPYFDRAVEGYLILLFVSLCRAGEKAEKPKHDEEFLSRLYAYFDAAGADASLKGFALSSGYNAGYMGRLVHEKTGESFSVLLSRHRLRRAAALLEQGELSVEDVAFCVGYANPSGLYKQFCSAYGMSPAAYRKMFR